MYHGLRKKLIEREQNDRELAFASISADDVDKMAKQTFSSHRQVTNVLFELEGERIERIYFDLIREVKELEKEKKQKRREKIKMRKKSGIRCHRTS